MRLLTSRSGVRASQGALCESFQMRTDISRSKPQLSNISGQWRLIMASLIGMIVGSVVASAMAVGRALCGAHVLTLPRANAGRMSRVPCSCRIQ